MTHRLHNSWIALVAAMIVLGGVGFCPLETFGQRVSSISSLSNRVVSVGRLIRSGKTRTGEPRYGLLNDAGTLTAYLVAEADLELDAYTDKHVAVTAQRTQKSPDGLDHLRAERVKVMFSTDTMPAPEVTPTFADEVPARLAEDLTAVPLSLAPRSLDLRRLHEDENLSPTSYLARPPRSTRSGSTFHPGRSVAYQEGVPTEAIPMDNDSFGLIPGEEYIEGEPIGDGYPDVGYASPGTMGCDMACSPCGPSGQFWVRAEYLLWWSKGMDVPPLVTHTSGNPPVEDAGVLGVDGTNILYGGDQILKDTRSGFRLRTGMWLDCYQWSGLEFDFAYLEDVSEGFSAFSVGNPNLSRPFENALLNVEDSQLVAYPGIVSGTVSVSASSEYMTFSPRYRRNIKCVNYLPGPACGCSTCNECGDTMCRPSGGSRLDWTLGYRYMRLKDRLYVNERLLSVSGSTPTSFGIDDVFETDNEFHGIELGGIYEAYRGPWSMELISRLALGNNRRHVAINGRTDSAVQGASFSDVGGLLALSSNIGNYQDDQFVLIPEFGINLGYRIAPCARLIVGYTVIYWPDTVRAGNQVDRRVNPELLPPAIDTDGPLAPAFAFNDSSYWTQGLNFGIDWRW